MINLKLGTKFTLLLSIVFIGGVVVSGLVLWQLLQQTAQAQVTAKGLILIGMMNSVRHYTNSHINPLLADQLASQSTFIPESVPAFSAREVFETLRQDEAYARFFYKEASLNPTNLRNQADDFETALIERMSQEPGLTEVSGFRTLADENLYYIARPLVVGSANCLVCHSDPAVAPKNLIATYGAEHGFGWQLNQIIAAQIIYVPAEEVLQTALRSFLVVMGIFVASLALVLLLLNLLLRRYVIQPVGILGELAQKISADEVTTQELEADDLARVAGRTDELGHLAQLFQRMAQEVYSRTQTLKQQVQQLRIEINEIKRQEQVAEVVESDFFRDLQTKAQEMREQRRRPAPMPDDNRADEA